MDENRTAIFAEPERSERVDYPYGSAPLRADWASRRARAFAALAVGACAAALYAQAPIALSAFDDVALHVLFPAMLGFVLAFAPAPRTRIGRVVRDLTVVGLSLSVFAGDYAPLLIALYPLLLAGAVVIGDRVFAKATWGAAP